MEPSPSTTSQAIAAGLHYQAGRATACPDCGGTQWLVGRVSAECARCETPLPLALSAHRGYAQRYS